jgi:methionyl-tRNA formyltransferase
MYYELLTEGRLTATALFLDARIDTGAVVAERTFDPPPDRRTIDGAFDPWMRAVLLRDVLRDHAAGRPLAARPQVEVGARTYYVIHPVLRHVAILAGERGGAVGRP